MYYKASDGDGNLQVCKDFDPDFLAALETEFNVLAPSGEPYTLLTSLSLSQVMEQSRAYEFVLSRVIITSDVEAIQMALETAWKAEFNGIYARHVNAG
jgi:hypothetical protein